MLRVKGQPWIGPRRNAHPHSDVWGWDRGTPVDRYYIEGFLRSNRGAISGNVLEVGDRRYTELLGDNVVRSDVLDISAENPMATIVSDLSIGDGLPSATFDCFILVQTLQYIPNLSAAVQQVHRVLRPGGIVLCTVPSVSRVGQRYLETDHWRFTLAALRTLFADAFTAQRTEVVSFGNTLACTAFLTGLAWEELPPAKLDANDPHAPLIVAARARRATE